jgi:hypothetical protein
MALLIALLPYARAQSDGPPTPTATEESSPEVRYALVTELDIEGATVEGELYRPGNQLVAERPKPTHRSAIVLRQNFDDATAESTEFVR